MQTSREGGAGQLAMFLVSALITGLLASCGGGDSGTTPTPPATPVPTSLTPSAGDQQEAAGGTPVAVAPAVLVRDAAGQPMSGVTVQFSVTEGGGSISGGAPATNAQGIAAVGSWTLGPNGTQRLRAQVGSLAPVTFEATITPGTEQLVATIGSGGGSFEITDPAHAFHGFELAVPAGTVSGSAEWRFRVAQIAPTVPLPAGFRVAGPVLEISTTLGRTGELITLDIPVSPDPGEDVVIVLRDPARGVMEVMPIVAREPNSVRVVTTHLRGDLLLGPTPAGGAPAGSVRSGIAFGTDQVGAGVFAQLFAIGYQTPLPPVSASLNRWPVLDHGSHWFPEGHGAAVSVVQAVGAALQGLPSFSSLVRPLDAPGTYAEAAPLAVKTLATAETHEFLRGVMQRVHEQIVMDQWERDRLITNQVIAKMALEGRVAAMAHTIAGLGGNVAFTTALAGSMSGLTAVTATEEAPTEISLAEGSGFQTVQLRLIADGPQIPVSDAFPLSSFLAPFERITGHIQKLGQLVGAPLGSTQRAQLNAELAAEAGLPTPRLEVQAVEGGGWFAVEPGQPLVVRNTLSQIRLREAISSRFSLHLTAGAEIGRTEATTLSLADVAAIAAQADLTPVQHVVSAFSLGAGNAARQISAAFQEIVKAPFRIEPAGVVLDGANTSVELAATVPEPPQGGFRVHWDWGDGQESDLLGLTAASHTYDDPGDYRVVATLTSADRSTVLAADTIQVGPNPGSWVGWVTAIDVRAEGTTTFQATNVRFSHTGSPGEGWWTFMPTAGQLTYSRVVPCADYVSPVTVVDLATAVDSVGTFLWASRSGEQAPEGSGVNASFWYQGVARASGLQVWNMVCPTELHPNPSAYIFQTSFNFFRTFPANQATTTPSHNWNLMEGTTTQSALGATTTWTWRFERVYE